MKTLMHILLAVGTSQLALASELFTDSARIYPGTQECSDDFSRVKDCYNRENPARPSIMRSLDRASLKVNSAENAKVQAYPRQNSTSGAGKTAVLPWSRSTSDGRLRVRSEASGIRVSLFEPQQLKHGLKMDSDAILSTYVDLPNILHLDPNRATVDYKNPAAVPQYWHLDVCHDRYLKEGVTSRSCSAPLDKNSDQYVYGECYDFTIVTKMASPFELRNFELRSVPVTVFVKNSKSADNDKSLHLYARTKNSILPPISITSDWEIPKDKSLTELSHICSNSSSSFGKNFDEKIPYYCQFLKAQSYSQNGFRMHAPWTQTFNDNDYINLAGGDKNNQGWMGFNIFEPTISLDGRLMVMNSGYGLYYSYSEDPCRADKWVTFEPLSKIPIDPQIYNNYDIGRSQRSADGKPIFFRDTIGKPIMPGDRIEGAYLWLDRLGRNLTFTNVNSPRDNYLDIVGANRSSGPGMVNSILGSWTQGKIVSLDNALLSGDISQVQGGENSFSYNFYQGDVIGMRPTGLFQQNSFENEQNFYEALAPTLPFDVVWRMSGDTQKNVEVAFDEYMMNNAFIIAHMNAPVAMKFGNALIDDGFEPVNTAEAHNVRYGGQAKFSFKSSPKIQNSATSSPDYSKERADIVPSYLKLFGGARVEPVHLGGVIGKGLYLDGKNDHLVASYPVPKKHNQWLIGVWLDSREENNTTVRNVFQFADSSTIGVSLTKIKAYDGVQGKVGEVDISRFGLTANKFFHFSVVIKTQLLLKQRTLEFFINGTKAGALAFKYQWNPGFSFKSIIEAVAYGVNSRPIEEIFVLGATKGLPFKGWVDELRVYGLGLAQDTGTKKELYNDHFWGEFTCNLAYGSIARMSSKDLQSSNDKIRALAQYANRVSPFYPVKTANTELSKIVQTVDKTVFVCEQFKLGSHTEPSDFVPQVEKTICAGRTHLNDPDDEDFQRYCMRPYYMRVHDKKLDPEKPRPNFSQTNFCLSCHHQEAKVAGLGLDALSFKGNTLKHADKRRQPLEFPGVLHGCVQESSEAIASSEERCVGDQSSDLFFEGKGKIKPD